MQSDEKHSIDEIFRQGLENFSTDKSTTGNWDTMRHLLVKEGIIKEGRKRNWGSIAWLSFLCAGIIYGLAHYFTGELTNPDAAPKVANTVIKDKNEINEAPQIVAKSVNAVKKKNLLPQSENKKSEEPIEDVFLRNLTGSYDNEKIWTNRVIETPAPEVKPVTTESEKVVTNHPPKYNPEEAEKPVTKNYATKASPEKSKKSGKKKNEPASVTAPPNANINPVEKKVEAKEKTAPKKKESKKKETPKADSEKNYLAKKDVLLERKDNSFKTTNDSIRHNKNIMDSEFTRIIPTKDPIDNNFSHFALGTYLSYNIDKYKIVQNTVPDYYQPGDIQDKYIKGENNLTYSAGLMARYRFTYHLMVEAGALYSQKRKVLYTANEVNRKKDSFATQYSNYTFSYNSRYIDIPIQAKGFIPIGMVNLQLAAGAILSFNAPFGSKSYYSWQHVSDAPNAKNDLKKVFMSGKSSGIIPYGSIGINYVYNRKWEFFVEPSYKFNQNSLLSANQDVPVIANHFLRTISLGFGAFYNF